MEVGIIGAGMIGGTLARRLAERDARVALGTRRAADPRLAALPPEVARVTPAEAARFGAATIVAVPFSAWPGLMAELGPALDGRVVLDTSNAIPGRDGAEADKALASGAGSGAAVAALLPRARIVKAFNTVYYATLAAGGTPPIAIPLAGDDAAAVATAVLPRGGFADSYDPGAALEIVQFTRPGNGSVNSFVFVGPDSLAIVDTQRTMVEARALAALAQGLGKPVEAIFLTHEHIDHAGGLGVLARAFPEAALIGSGLTDRLIAEEVPGVLEFMRPMMGAAIDSAIPQLTRIVEPGETVRLAGVDWTVDQRGPAEAQGMTLLYSQAEDVLIASDAFGNRARPGSSRGAAALGWKS